MPFDADHNFCVLLTFFQCVHSFNPDDLFGANRGRYLANSCKQMACLKSNAECHFHLDR